MKDRKRPRRRKRVYCWYACPGNAHSNQVIGHMLSGETTDEIPCSDGHKREMWQCTFAQAQHLMRSRRDNQLTVSIFSRIKPNAARNVSVIFMEKKQTVAA